MKRNAQAIWSGDLKSGKGSLSTDSGALKATTFQFDMRFGDAAGTNPEELIAAALAGCFSMALSGNLNKAGYEAQKISTNAALSLEQIQGTWTLAMVHLECKAQIPEIELQQFEAITQETKETCPVARALNMEITIKASLEKV